MDEKKIEVAKILLNMHYISYDTEALVILAYLKN